MGKVLAGPILREAGPVGAVGLALPGIVDRAAGMLLASPSSGWRRVPFVGLFTAAFGLPVFADNDVNACAWAESLFGASRSRASSFWMTVSTGIGGALAYGGRIIEGASGMAGEVGHLVVNPGGEPCGCGNRGCLEAEAAGPAWRRKALAALEAGEETSLRSRAREAIDAAAVAEEARRGDELSLAIVAEVASMLARGIAAIENILDPELIVVGGGVAASLDLLLPRIRAELPSLELAHERRRTEIVPSALGYDAALVGAAALALHPY